MRNCCFSLILKARKMQFTFDNSIPILERTPSVLRTLLNNLADDWVMSNEGPATFSPYDVVGHLVHGEKTDWVIRIRRILDIGTAMAFDPYDRFAQYEESKGKDLMQLINEFEQLRIENLNWLKSLKLTEADFDKKGMHPSLGEVTLKNLLATWVVHDLTHIAQITRVMAKQYKDEMGPWTEFFRILSF
ncbi:MAG TPA: DinB family protein [Chitinophagaceae bacterium]|nr:DinB family protein [Chitinophagaceae bacterium]